MSSKPQQIRNASLYLLPIVIGNLVPLVTLPILTRVLTAEDFGAWALANAYAVVAGGLAAVGLPIAYDRNFFEYAEPRQRSALLYTLVGFSAVSFALCGAATWALRGPITAWLIGDLVYQQVLVWSFASTAVAGLKGFYLAYLRNSEQAGAFSMYTIGERLLSAVLTVLFVAWARMGVVGLVAGQLLATLAVLVVVAVRSLRQLPPSADRHLLADSLSLGLPLMPRILFGVVGSNFDKYLIGQLSSLGGVGIYSIGQRVASIAFTYMTALQNVFGPQVYQRMFSSQEAVRRSIGSYLTPFAYASTVVAFLIAVFSEEILIVLAPPSYRGAIPIVGILALYYAILFFGKIPQITYARKTYLVSALAAMSTVVSVAMGAAGIWMAGTIGAAWGALGAGVVMTTTTFIVGQRCFRIAWESRKLVAIFGLLFGSALLVNVLRAGGAPYGVLLVVKFGAVAGFVWLGVRLGFVTRENLLLVRDLVSPRKAVAGVH
jgi:O-antigen/teichoic acid export membrane protein